MLQEEKSAGAFYTFFRNCTADPEKNVLNNPHLRNNKKKKEKKKPVKVRSPSALSKTSISKPCEFIHMTKLQQSEDGILALAMVPATDDNGSEDGTIT